MARGSGSPGSPGSPVPDHSAELVPGRHGIRYPAQPYAQAFLGLIRAGAGLQRELDRDLRTRHGLGLRGYEVLLHLATFSPDGELPMAQLARQAPLSQSQVSRVVAELDERGLVRRTVDDRDSRAVRVALTDRGLAALHAAQDTHHRGLETKFFQLLTRDEVAELARVTSKLLGDSGAPSGG